MSASPADDETQTYIVVVNNKNQHSLWPELVDIPTGWSPVFGPAGHDDCIAYVDRSWTDLGNSPGRGQIPPKAPVSGG